MPKMRKRGTSKATASDSNGKSADINKTPADFRMMIVD
jgi:hypothetical protein